LVIIRFGSTLRMTSSMQNCSICLWDVRGVLGRDDDVGDGDRLAVLVDHRDLRLGVGPQPRRLALLADLGQLAAEAVREHDGRGHQLRRLVAGIAEHQALVAGALLGGLLAGGLARVHALGDVGRLLRHQHVHEHLVGMEHVVVVDVADAANRLAGDLHEVEPGLGRDLAADDDDVRLDEGLARDAAELVLSEAGVEDGVRNRVGDLVGMSLADRFRREDVPVAHSHSKKKARVGRGPGSRLRLFSGPAGLDLMRPSSRGNRRKTTL
jgi:hypothetical protein